MSTTCVAKVMKNVLDHYDPEDLEKIIETQRKVVQYMKDHKRKALSDFNFGG